MTDRGYYISNCIERLIMASEERYGAIPGRRHAILDIAYLIAESSDATTMHERLIDLVRQIEIPRPLDGNTKG